jgi:acyl-CoA thioesterase
MSDKNHNDRAKKVIDQMYYNDAFSLWLGIERIEESAGYCKLRMQVRKEMLNGFKIAHGGISFSLADSALAFASNSHGKHAVSIDCVVNHLKAIKEGDVLMAEALEKSRSNRLGVYEVTVKNQKDELVALFKGMVFIKDTDWQLTMNNE